MLTDSPSKQGGEENTLDSLFSGDLGLSESLRIPEDTLDLFCSTLQLAQGCAESQSEALGSLSAVFASRGSSWPPRVTGHEGRHKILNLEHVPEVPISSSRQHPVPISQELLS